MLAFLILIAVVVVFTTLAARSSFGSGGRQRAYQQLATRYRGQFQRGSWTKNPAVRFRYRDVAVLLGAYQRGGPTGGPMTQVRFPWPDTVLFLEIVPQGIRQPTLARPDALPVDVGDEAFDSAYRVRTQDAEAARRLLTPAVQWQVQKLRQLLDRSACKVQWNQGSLLIQKETLIGNRDVLDEFVRLCLEFYDQAMLTCCDGIEFADDGMAQPVADAKCQVCGELIVEELVFCRRCKTPHHRDCWQYNGCCTTFGCGEKQFLVPGQAESKTTTAADGTKGKPR